ncbi:hypothetical protein KJ797_04455, partial [Patescibacteria group bacterium]|nr:hypothetical protein [Patescibacteria group bacterium]
KFRMIKKITTEFRAQFNIEFHKVPIFIHLPNPPQMHACRKANSISNRFPQMKVHRYNPG